MGTALESKVRIQREDFSVTDEIEVMKKSSRNIGGITIFLGTGRELNKGESIAELNSANGRKEARRNPRKSH